MICSGSKLLFALIHGKSIQIVLIVLTKQAGVRTSASHRLIYFIPLSVMNWLETFLLVWCKAALMLQCGLLRCSVISHAGDLAECALSFAFWLWARLLRVADLAHADLRIPLPHFQRSTQLRPRLAALNARDLYWRLKLLLRVNIIKI